MTGRIRGNRPSRAVALFVLGFAACNTYDDSLLVTLNPNLPAGDAGTSGGSSLGGAGAGAGAGAGGAVGSAGTGAVADSGGYDEAGSGGMVEGGAAGESAGGTAGGASGGAGAGGTVITAGAGGSLAGAASGSFELIDDFEDGDAVVIPIHGRNGPWYTFADTTPGQLTPFTVVALTGTNAHDGSTVAARLTATGFTDWGAGVGADLVNTAGNKVAYDVSAYRGVHFYAKVATGAANALKLLVTTTYSDASGGICSDALPAAMPSQRCSDHLYLPKTITTTWATYDVMFADLIQQGFGLTQAKLDPKSVYSLQFTMPAKLATKAAPVDLWLDDVSFIVK